MYPLIRFVLTAFAFAAIPMAITQLVLLPTSTVLGSLLNQNDNPNDGDTQSTRTKPPPPKPIKLQKERKRKPKKLIATTDPYGKFDQDSRDDCSDFKEHCQSDLYGHIYIQCAKTCTEFLQLGNGGGGEMKGTTELDLYSLPSQRLYNANHYHYNKIELDRFEGSVLLVGIVPLLPGMAAYYYELLVHLHQSFMPHMECMIVPIDHGLGIHIRETQQIRNEQNKNNNQKNSNSNQDDDLTVVQQVWVLEEETDIMKHPVIRFLHDVKPRSGSGFQDHNGILRQVDLNTDRVTIYIVSADGYFVERLISPTLATLQSKVRIYIKTIDYKDL